MIHSLYTPMSNLSEIGEAVADIQSFFSNIGTSCVDMLNGALSVFSKFVYTSIGVLTMDINDDTFSDFWDVISNVSSVLCIIASTLMVLLFLVNMCTDAWDTRHDLDMFGFMKKCAKMLVAIVLVNNAVPIVTTIFKLGAKVAQIITFGDQAEGVFYNTLKISDTQAVYVEYGVSGFQGFLKWLAFFICSIVVIVSGITITIEIYSRIFKMFILIPFSTISFTTFVMGDGNRGNEVFHGYLKSILSTAIEAVIIMVMLSFTTSLMAGDTMEKLLPAMETEASEEICVNGTELVYLAARIAGEDTYANKILKNYSGDIGSKVKEIADAKGRSKAISKYGCIVTEDGIVIEGANDSWYFDVFTDNSDEISVKVRLYPAFTWKGVFMIILQILFPIVLCTGAIKSVEKYTGMILGH